MKYPFESEPNTSVVFPVFSFTFTNEVTLQVPTSCCLSGSAAPADNAVHVSAAAIGIDNSAFMGLPPVFRHVPSVTGSGLAAQPSQSLENIARGTRRSMGQFIPEYRTARSAHEIMVGGPAEAVERESRGLWGKTGQRSLERSA